MIDNIAENVLKDGKDGIKQNMLKIFDEFIDEYADEMWQVVNEFIKLKSENAELKHRAEVAERALKECSKRLSTFTKSFGDGETEDQIYEILINKAEKELLEEKE